MPRAAKPKKVQTEPLKVSIHKHKCSNQKCGHVWQHADSCANDFHCHTCPRCGTLLSGLWPVYNGPEDAGSTQLSGIAMPDGSPRRVK
jgi:hypothetical protein